MLEVSRSSFYAWLAQAELSVRALENKQLTDEIKMIFIAHRCRYGSRRIKRSLINKGYRISRRHVGKLMRVQDLYCKTRKRFAECGLELHPVKTKIVCCKDRSRRGNHSQIKFDFLGYTFRPRAVMNDKTHTVFVSFSPAVSGSSRKSMRAKTRKMR